MSRTHTRLSAAVLGLVLVACAVVFVAARSATPTRHVVLVARGMTFALADAPDATNPPLRFLAGERVRLTFRNESPGLSHDLAVPAWGVETRLLRAGEEDSVTFVVPASGAEVDYVCRPHAQMMRGRIGIAAR